MSQKEINRIIKKLVTVEFSKDINNPDIGIIGALDEAGRKIVNIYKVDRGKYTPKLKVKEISRNYDNLKELADNNELICRLVFNNNESIESLIYILSELYNIDNKNIKEYCE